MVLILLPLIVYLHWFEGDVVPIASRANPWIAWDARGTAAISVLRAHDVEALR